MAWKARDVDQGRMEFVLRALVPGSNVSRLCAEYGISRTTGYKWLNRYRAEGDAGLRNRSSRPRGNSLAVGGDTVAEIVRIRRTHGWGPDKIRAVLEREQWPELPGSRTIGRVLLRCGMQTLKPKRPRPVLVSHPVVWATDPNEVWTVDFKGWWRTQDRKRFEPLTVRDEASRFVLAARSLEDNTGASVRVVFEELFSRYGLPWAIRSDNGSPFACTRAPCRLSRLSAWWVSLGIKPLPIDPGKPQQNGAHERMHLDIAVEIECFPAADRGAQQQALDRWRPDFNHLRPHQALGMKVPADIYRRSNRYVNDFDPPIVYPDGFEVRRVRVKGDIRIDGRRHFISEAVGGHQLGIERTGNDIAQVWFAQMLLGKISLNDESQLRPTGEADNNNQVGV